MKSKCECYLVDGSVEPCGKTADVIDMVGWFPGGFGPPYRLTRDCSERIRANRQVRIVESSKDSKP